MHSLHHVLCATAAGLGVSLFSSSALAQSVRIVHNSTVAGSSTIARKTEYSGSPQIVALRDTFLMVGDQYAALSQDQGQAWSYRDPSVMFPSTHGIALDSMRLVKPRKFDMAVWVLAHNPASATTNNEIRLAVAKGRNKLRAWGFSSFMVSASALGAGASEYARVQDVEACDRFLYVSATIIGGGLYRRSTVGRIALQDLWRGVQNPVVQLKRSTTMGGGYYGFARGCTDTMYFAALKNSTTMRVFSWRYDTGLHRAVDRAIGRWYGGFSNSVLRDGKNWLANDNRTIHTGYRVGGEVAFLFDSNKGGTHQHPFIRVSRFRTSTLALIREHELTNRNHAWAFPSVTVGANNTVAFKAYIGGPFLYPSIMVGILDGAHAGNWDALRTKIARYGAGSPAQARWGFRSNVIEHPSFPGNYLAAGQVMTSAGNHHENCEHRSVWFCKDGDQPTPVTLSVSSPNVAPTIHIDIRDIHGQRNGQGSFTRQYWRNQGFSMTAPYADSVGDAVYVFDRWVLNGTVQPVGRSIQVEEIGANMDAVGRFVRGRKLYTSSVPVRAGYDLSVPAASGTTSASTSSSHIFREGTNVTITFRQTAQGRRVRSVRSGSITPTNARTITLKMDRDRGVIATYGYYTSDFVQNYGSACAGTNGMPRQLSTGRAAIGETITHHVKNGIRNGFAFAVFGGSRTTWNGTPLPFQFPGTACLMLVSPDLLLGTSLDPYGDAEVPIQIPNDTKLIGVRYYSQFAIHDPGVRLELATTNAFEVRVGGWDIR